MTDTSKVKVLVVDDTVVYRKIVSDILAEMPNVDVVGTANNGKVALDRIGQFDPDLLILDVEMPEMDGLELLAHIQKRSMDVGAIMLSSFTKEGSERTITALELGAFDFIPKPETHSLVDSKQAVRDTLGRVVNAFARQRDAKKRILARGGGKRPETPTRAIAPPRTHDSQVVAIGISTGGPNALKHMLPQLPSNLGVPVLVVQHMPPIFTKSLADSLNKKCSLEVVEAKHRQAIEANTVYIAPGGKHMKVAEAANSPGKVIKLADDPPENGCKPAVDYLFRSVSQVYGGNATAVIMTGMGSDGRLGMKLMKRVGTVTIAQDKESCVVYGMPKEAIEAGVVDIVAPLDSIAEQICKTIKQKRAVLA